MACWVQGTTVVRDFFRMRCICSGRPPALVQVVHVCREPARQHMTIGRRAYSISTRDLVVIGQIGIWNDRTPGGSEWLDITICYDVKIFDASKITKGDQRWL